MTTANEVMPTLREIEAGLRQRLIDLTTLRDTERDKREAARTKVEQVAISAANNNSIGEVADDLLIELGLHGRPRDVSVMLSVETRQDIPVGSVRDTYINGMQLFGAYQVITDCSVYNTFDLQVSVLVPRDHEGCACSITVTQEALTNQLGTMPATVEIVDTTVKWCGFNSYPYTANSDMENKCLNYRRLRAQEKADAHDDPLVQKCEYGHNYTEPHRHIFYNNGDVTYSLRADYAPESPTVVVPGWYHTDSRIGERIPGSPAEYNPDDPNRLLLCEQSGHPRTSVHLHWRNPDDGHITWSRSLDYESDNATKVDGLFTRDATRVGNLHTD